MNLGSRTATEKSLQFVYSFFAKFTRGSFSADPP